MNAIGPPDTPGWTLIGARSYADSVPDLPDDIWEVPWRNTGKSIQVTDPIYGNQRSLSICEVDAEDRVVTFAVEEVSNGVFLFSLPGVR